MIKNKNKEYNWTFLPEVTSKCEEYTATTTGKQESPD